MQLNKRLTDNCFVLATELMNTLATAFEGELGRKPTIEELCDILTWGARSSVQDITADAVNRDITLVAKVSNKRAKIKLQRGDVLSVPIGGGEFGAMVFLENCGTFGAAFGLIGERTHPGVASSSDWEPRRTYEHPIFADDDGVKTGRWFVVARREDLAVRFRKPELFYDARDHPGDPTYGEYGLAESPDGALRFLGAVEAKLIFGVSLRRYEQGFMCDDLEEYFAGALRRPAGH